MKKASLTIVDSSLGELTPIKTEPQVPGGGLKLQPDCGGTRSYLTLIKQGSNRNKTMFIFLFRSFLKPFLYFFKRFLNQASS
jgi:hypothetical protein